MPTKPNNHSEIKLGNVVKDIVSGFSGVATTKLEYLNGCVQFAVQPKGKANKKEEAYYFDWQQLEIVSKGIAINGEGTGGPGSGAPTRYGMTLLK